MHVSGCHVEMPALILDQSGTTKAIILNQASCGIWIIGTLGLATVGGEGSRDQGQHQALMLSQSILVEGVAAQRGLN